MTIIRLSFSAGAYGVYGIKAAGLLFGLEDGTGEPKTIKGDRNLHLYGTDERTVESLMYCLFLEHLGRIDA
jgi:hypothetical protein